MITSRATPPRTSWKALRGERFRLGEPGTFRRFQNVTAMSHETAESYNDPFVASDGAHNITPWWAGPNGYICENNLEDGDVIEGMPNATYPMTRNGYTYHPQKEALLQWFQQQPLSHAISAA